MEGAGKGDDSGALGIAVLGSVVTAIYRHDIAGNIPTSVPQQAAQTARDTLGGALSIAADLPQALAAQLTHVARVAYTDAFQAITLTCATIVILAAVVAARLLRRVGMAGDAPPDGGAEDTCPEAAE